MNAIRSYRKQHRLSQAAFGRLVGLPQTTIASYESGARRPRPKIAKQIYAKTGGEISVYALRPDIYGNHYAPIPAPQPATGQEVAA